MSKHVETAFPCHGPSGQVFEYGLTKREWFAGMALQGWLSSFGPDDDCSSSATKAAIAKQSFQLADAMLAALAEKGNGQ